MAYTSGINNGQSNTDHQIKLAAKGISSNQTLPDLPNGNFEQKKADLWKLDIEDFFGFSTCITKYDIESICIKADSDNEWNIGSIVTFAVIDIDHWELISADYNVNQWVDGYSKVEGRETFMLSLTTTGPCINYLYVIAYTSNSSKDSGTQDIVSHDS